MSARNDNVDDATTNASTGGDLLTPSATVVTDDPDGPIKDFLSGDRCPDRPSAGDSHADVARPSSGTPEASATGPIPLGLSVETIISAVVAGVISANRAPQFLNSSQSIRAVALDAETRVASLARMVGPEAAAIASKILKPAVACSAETVPLPGNTYVIRARDTGHVISLAHGDLKIMDLDYVGDRASHWKCELKGGWFAFKNVVTNNYCKYASRAAIGLGTLLHNELIGSGLLNLVCSSSSRFYHGPVVNVY